jgi:hypothetical protein
LIIFEFIGIILLQNHNAVCVRVAKLNDKVS